MVEKNQGRPSSNSCSKITEDDDEDGIQGAALPYLNILHGKVNRIYLSKIIILKGKTIDFSYIGTYDET